jgi:hypothetical protein
MGRSSSKRILSGASANILAELAIIVGLTGSVAGSTGVISFSWILTSPVAD